MGTQLVQPCRDIWPCKAVLYFATPSHHTCTHTHTHTHTLGHTVYYSKTAHMTSPTQNHNCKSCTLLFFQLGPPCSSPTILHKHGLRQTQSTAAWSVMGGCAAGEYYCTTVLLHYCTTVLLHYCTTVLLYYCTTILLYYCTTVLLYYCTTVLLYYCTTVLLYYCTTALLYYCTTVLLYIVSNYASSVAQHVKCLCVHTNTYTVHHKHSNAIMQRAEWTSKF